MLSMLYISVLHDKCVIPIYATLKQTRLKAHLKPLQFKVYSKEPKLCVVDNLKEYLLKTKDFRTHPALFLSMQKPYKPVSKDTISRWCKDIMLCAGIDTNQYTTHSSRSAASSYAKTKGVSLKNIVDSAGWSNEHTFARFYDKDVVPDVTIGQLMLSHQ